VKVLVISDVHANLTALEAVLKDAGDFDEVWCLGDITGYGPDPNECIERVRSLPNLTCLSGNHDQAVLNRISLLDFNDEARYAVMWTSNVISKENFLFLSSQPTFTTIGDYTLAHASPRHPIWEYILDTQIAKVNFNHFKTSFCLVGHTHLPLLFYQNGKHQVLMDVPQAEEWITLSGRCIINPGSVGQPRDHNPLASYLILDPLERMVQYRRVAYDIAAVQKRMLQVGLPYRHVARLSNGY